MARRLMRSQRSTEVQRSTIPNMAGKAMTVNGPVDPDRLGVSIMHEHLFIDLTRDAVPAHDTPATLAALWEEPLTLENVHDARQRRPSRDNRILADVETAIAEAMEYRNAGGNTIVDVTSIGLRRDPLALRRVANATGLNIVMGAGWYRKEYHPPDMDQRTVEDMTAEIIRDVTVGVGDTGIRSGIIGEVGIEGNPLRPNEIKSIRASGRASRATGAAISFHRGGYWRERLQTIGMLGEEGADLSRVVFGHSDFMASDVPLMLEVLSSGAYIQFDALGRVGAPLELHPRDETIDTFWNTASTALVAEGILKLIEAGFEDRIMLSQDVCTKVQLKRYGGTGYSFVLEKFLPHLRTQGVTEAQINKMMVETPKRVLTFVSPQ